MNELCRRDMRVMMSTYHYPVCVDVLGRRLEMAVDADDSEMSADARLCYIVSGNTERLIASWDKLLLTATQSASHQPLQVVI